MFVPHSFIKKSLVDWKEESHSTAPIMFRVHNNTLYIYTSQPGYLIGKAGYLVNKYSAVIKEQTDDEFELEIVDVDREVI